MATNSIQEDSIESQSNAEPAPSLTPIKPTSEEISENQMKLLILSDIGNVVEEETEEIAENQLLISSDIGNVAEEETPITGENGSLHDQGSVSDVEESKIEQELETDSIPTGSGSMPLEHVAAAGESLSPGVVWRENSELEAVVPSSTNGSGYAATSEEIAENQMKTLSLSDIGNVAEEETPILVENGSFHDQGSENVVEASKIERELETDSIPFCSGSMPLELVAEVGESSSPGVVWRENPELDAEVPLSPTSSGYAGERGSSSTPSVGSGSGIEEAGGSTTDGTVEAGGEIRVHQDNCIDIFSDSASWIPGKRHLDEDDASISWRKRKKHFFVLSNSGKPIYSRYGDEHKLAGFSATLQAIISFVENGGDRVKFIRAGKHQVIFLVKGPIYLVCISCTEEPYEALRGQLELIYGQIILILTKSVNRCFDKNPKFDMTPLLGGTDAVFSSLIHAFSWNPATFLHAYTCLPLAYPTRQAAGSILQDVADSGVLFAILMCKHKVISLVGAQKASLHPDDMLLLSNFVLSSESFRTSESFSPICLPRYNPMAFLYAYVHYLDVDTYLMLLTTSSDAFYHLKDCRIRIEMVLLKSNVLSEVQRSMLDGGLRVEDLPGDPSLRSGFPSPHLGHDRLTPAFPENSGHESSVIGGPGGLWHFIYRSIYLDQYVASEFSSPINNSNQQKRLYRAYQQLYASMHDRGAGPHKTQFRRDENYVLLCWITQDFELYAAFDPLADKALAIKICNRVCQWVRDLENEIFLLGASPFSW